MVLAPAAGFREVAMRRVAGSDSDFRRPPREVWSGAGASSAASGRLGVGEGGAVPAGPPPLAGAGGGAGRSFGGAAVPSISFVFFGAGSPGGSIVFGAGTYGGGKPKLVGGGSGVGAYLGVSR